MSETNDPLQEIGYITIPANLVEKYKEFDFDPQIMLPVNFGAKSDAWCVEHITWESIITGMLRVLIYNPENAHLDYYRMLIRSLRPNIKQEFTKAGIIKAKNKEFALAIEIFRALLGFDPDCAISALNLALVYEDAAEYYKGSNSELAEEYWEKAFYAYQDTIKKAKAPPEVHLNYGYFFLRQENYEKAQKHFRIYLDLEKDQVKTNPIKKILSELDNFGETDSLFKQAFDNIAMGKEKQGICKAKKLLKNNPHFSNAWFLLGWGLRRLSQFNEAKKAYLSALEFGKEHPDLLNELAIVYMELGEFDESYKCLSRALKKEPQNIKIIANLGVLAIKKGDLKEASKYFKIVLAIAPHDKIAKSYLDVISRKK